MNFAFFTENGRYLGRLKRRQSDNVLLRRAQYRISGQNLMPIACEDHYSEGSRQTSGCVVAVVRYFDVFGCFK